MRGVLLVCLLSYGVVFVFLNSSFCCIDVFSFKISQPNLIPGFSMLSVETTVLVDGLISVVACTVVVGGLMVVLGDLVVVFGDLVVIVEAFVVVLGGLVVVVGGLAVLGGSWVVVVDLVVIF